MTKVLIPDGRPRKRYSEVVVADAINAVLDVCTCDEDTNDLAVGAALAVLGANSNPPLAMKIRANDDGR